MKRTIYIETSVDQIVTAMGYTMPVVCTPEELMEEIQDERSDS